MYHFKTVELKKKWTSSNIVFREQKSDNEHSHIFNETIIGATNDNILTKITKDEEKEEGFSSQDLKVLDKNKKPVSMIMSLKMIED